jgi:hypothetical protein
MFEPSLPRNISELNNKLTEATTDVILDVLHHVL